VVNGRFFAQCRGSGYLCLASEATSQQSAGPVTDKNLQGEKRMKAVRWVKTAKQGKIMARSGWIAAAAALLCLSAVGCGNNVKGHKYAAADNSVTIDFQSGGSATVNFGGIPGTCTYTQSGKQINLTCGGQTEALTMADDGSLSGGADSPLGHLTKVK
jgi:hypothetical protein